MNNFKIKFNIVITELMKIFKRFNLNNPSWSIFEHIKYVKKIKKDNKKFKNIYFVYYNKKKYLYNI